jgi:PmbA protein
MSDQKLFRTFLSEALESRLQDGIQRALKLGAFGAEAFVSISNSHKAKVQNGNIQDLSTSKRGGLGVRVLRNGNKGLRTGIATTTDLTRDNFLDLFTQAWQLSALVDEDRWIRQAEPSGCDDIPSRYNQNCSNMTTKERIQFAITLEEEARSASTKVSSVRESAWTDGTGVDLLLTQRGVRTHNLVSSCYASIELAVTDDGDRQAAWHWDLARNPADINLRAIGHEAVKKGELKLKPSRLTSGKYTVILHPEVTAEILSLVAMMLSANAVLKGKSIFANKINEPVASKLLTLIDDRRMAGGFGSTPWDGEGLPTRKNVLIEDGVLRTYLQTLKTAAEMNSAPTGSASRGIGNNPHAATFNLFPKPGTQSPEELYQIIGEGILITDMMGLHTVNPVSGDLSVGACGVRIRGGALAESVDRITLAGNLKDFLTKILALGNDLRWYGNNAGLSLLLEDISLGGV